MSDAQPTIPLVLTYHPTNAQVKSSMTRDFHSLTLPSYKLPKSMCIVTSKFNLSGMFTCAFFLQ